MKVVGMDALRREARHPTLELDLGGTLQEPFNVLDRVPPEIFRCIFELLGDDKKTFSSCSCISRHWREVSIPWLFAQISILNVQQSTDFLQFVDTHPHLRAHIKRLRFHTHEGPSPPFDIPPPIPGDSLRTFLSSVVSELPSLQTLSLYNVRAASDADCPPTLPLVDLERKPQSNRRLRKLSIFCGTIGLPSWTSTLIWFLSRYTVDALDLSGIEIPLNDLSDSVAASALNYVRNSVQVPKLVLNESPSWHQDTYSFLEALLQPGSVQAVSVTCLLASDIPRIPRFMGVVGQNVTYVSLDLAWFTLNSTDLTWVGLGKSVASCPRLERLRIRISAFSMGDYSGLPRHAVFTTIVPSAPRTLQTLTVELAKETPLHRGMGDMETWDLLALGEYLTREPAAFPSLRSVDVVLTLELADDNDELAEILMPELSALKDAGLLRVFCDEMTQSSRTVFGIDPLPTREE